MDHLSVDYRLSLYSELVELSQNKIYIVQNSLDGKIYIKKILYPENYEIYTKLQKLSSPNVPDIYEVIQSDNKLVIIEEYINGDSLEEKLMEYKNLPENVVIEYAIELCNVLDILHSCIPPIIHRDIKPANIIISNDNILKLIDFDVSRIHKESRSTDTEILGTYGYAAPEQFGFSQSDPRTDIYSFGITINMLLTGKFPIDELYKGNLSDIISKCTKLDPDIRFQNVKELKLALLDKSSTHKDNSKLSTNTSHKLPGFKSDKKPLKILGFIWYGFLLLAGLGFFTEDLTTESRTSDMTFAAFFFAVTLLFGNYKNLKTRFPLLSSKRFIIRLIGYGLYLLLILFILGILFPD